MIEFAAIRVAGLADDEQDILNDLLNLWRTKRKRNQIRALFYDMKNATDRLMSSNVPDVVKRRSFALGWSAVAVDKLNRRCNLEGFYDEQGRDLNEFGMDVVIRDNRLYDELSQAGISSLIHTPSWIITTQGDVASGEPDVLMNMRDALTGAGVWDGRLRRTKHYMSLNEFDDAGEPIELTLYLFGLNITCSRREGGWRVTDRRRHAYGVPVDPMRYRPRLNRPMGSSRISRAVMSIHSQALSAMIRSDVNGEAYSLSRYVALGVTESAFQNPDGSPKPAWQAAWDAVWAVGDDEDATHPRADIKQFHGQSPEPQMAHLRMLAGLMQGETGIPIGEFGVVADSNPTSWQAMETSRDDISSEARQVTETWKPDVSAAARRALAMKNKGDIPDDLYPTPHYGNPQFTSPAAAADSGMKMVTAFPALGNTEVGLELIGLRRDQIDRAMVDMRRNQGRQELAQILERARSGQQAPVTGDVAQ